MITKMRLENFKSWRELDLDLSNITILFGTNSSGKSSVLQSLLLLKQTAMGFDRKQPINLGGGETDYVDFGSYRDLVFGHDEGKRVGIRLEWDAQGHVQQGNTTVEKIAYSAKWRQLPDRVVLDQLDYDVVMPPNSDLFCHAKWKEENQYDYQLPYGATLVQGYEAIPPDLIPIIESCYSIYPLAFHHQSAGYFTMFFNSQFENLITKIDYLGPLRLPPGRIYFWKGTAPQGIGPRGEQTIDVLLWSERNGPKEHTLGRGSAPDLSKFVSKWLTELKLVSDFQVKPVDTAKRLYEARVKVTSDQAETSLSDVGFGISQVLPVITLLFFVPQGSIVLLEQPELHLHPSAQAHLADLFLHVAETRNLQLIVESHSEHLLRRLQRRIAEREYKFATPEGMKMYFCQLEQGESKLQPVQVDKYGQIANWPHNFFGDVSGDLDAMVDAALEQRRAELQHTE